MSFVIGLLIGLIIYLVILGAITMLLAWLISGHRVSVWNAIKANVFFWLTMMIMVWGANNSVNALGQHLPWLVVLIAGALLLIFALLIIPCWVFAHYLEINMLQAFAVLLLMWAISTTSSILLGPYVPADARQKIQQTYMTQTMAVLQENMHV